jgi:hypothetical protein
VLDGTGLLRLHIQTSLASRRTTYSFTRQGQRRVSFGGSIGASSVPREAGNEEFRSDIVGVGELIASEDRRDVVGTRILERGIALLTARGDVMEDSCRQAAS